MLPEVSDKEIHGGIVPHPDPQPWAAGGDGSVGNHGQATPEIGSADHHRGAADRSQAEPGPSPGLTHADSQTGAMQAAMVPMDVPPMAVEERSGSTSETRRGSALKPENAQAQIDHRFLFPHGGCGGRPLKPPAIK